MTTEELFGKVKGALGVTSDSMDDMIKPFFDDAIEYMKMSGITEETIESDSSVGVIARGTSDLWNTGSGSVSFSPYFHERVSQIALTEGDENV